MDRARFIDDLFAFARRGDYSLDQVLGFLSEFFSKEESAIVILELQRNLLDVIRISPRHAEDAKRFISDIVGRKIELTGRAPWDQQDLGETMYWEDILRYSLAFDCAPAIDLSLDLYREYHSTGKSHPAVHSSALCAAAYTSRIGIEDVVEIIKDDTTSAAERFVYLKVLASFKDPSAISRCVEYGMKELRPDLSKILMFEMLMTPWSWESIWNHFVRRPDSMSRFPGFTRGIIALNIIPLAAQGRLDEGKAFLDNLAQESITMAHVVQISKESIEADMEIRNRNK